MSPRIASGGLGFGYFVPNFMARGICASRLIEVARTIDQATSFGDLWVADHIVLAERIASRHPHFGRGAPPGTIEDFTRVGLGGMRADDPLFEPLTLLACLAGQTSRVGLGIGVLIVPLRHPVLTAKMLAGIDNLSGGRLIVATGTGWLREEYDAVGADWTRRGRVTDEYLTTMRSLWRPGDPADQPSGDSGGIDPNIKLAPKPAREDGVPIWVGGNTDPALRRAARLGTGWHGAQLGPAKAAERVSELQRLLAEQGRSAEAFTMSLRLTCWVSETSEPGSPDPLVGTPDEFESALAEYAAVGVQHIQLAPPPMVDLADLGQQIRLLDDLLSRSPLRSPSG